MLEAVIAAPKGYAQRWKMLLLLIGPVNFLISLDRQAMALGAPRIQELFHFTFLQMSVVVSCVLWTYTLLQIPAGAIVNFFGPRITLFVALSLWTLATLATPFAYAFYGFLAVRLVMGAGQAPDWAASIVAIDNWFGDKERSRANSVLLGFLYLGILFAGPATTHIIEWTSWKVSFYLYGVVGIGVAFVWWFKFRDHPDAHAAAKHAASAASMARFREIASRLLRSYQFWSIGLHYACLSTIVSFFVVLMPLYLVRDRHMTYISMGWLYSLPWLALYVSVSISGVLADWIAKRSNSIWAARTPAGIVGTLLSGLMLGLGARLENNTLMMLAFCIALGFAGLSQVSIWTSVQDITKGYTGLVTGWTTFWGNVAAAAAPIGIAYVEKYTGSWATAMLIPVVAGLFGTVFCLMTHPETPILQRDEP